MVDRHMREDLMLITHKGSGVNQSKMEVIQHTLTQKVDRDNLVDFLDGTASTISHSHHSTSPHTYMV
jgi:hypothetical protein